ncbi:hypothetical protein MP228_005698 [Amoeboaphelidium protococcarum]|nr:hypothetical protein MP228_005698 [Amoeboaphelidium protococcarum]
MEMTNLKDSDKQKVHLWLRAECKKNEKRVALTPSAVRQLVESGYFKITVERSTGRIFKDSEYSAIDGVQMADDGTWIKDAPLDAIIVGLKELPETYAELPEQISRSLNITDPNTKITQLKHTHIFFAHAYKGQAGWRELLEKFIAGHGQVLDLEFLVDEQGRRVAAFGYWAGYAGAAVGVMNWICQQKKQQLPRIESYANVGALMSDLKSQLSLLDRMPSVMVMGALGRCGTGAVDFCDQIGIKNVLKWDINETKKGGPFDEILQQDIFVNCIYLNKPIPAFLTKEMLLKSTSTKALSVIVDVSCDATNPHNPIPVYSGITTFDKPTVSVTVDGQDVGVDVVAIDHLPTLLPREASESYSKQLLPSIISLKDGVDSSSGQYTARVWRDAQTLFRQKAEEAKNK